MGQIEIPLAAVGLDQGQLDPLGGRRPEREGGAIGLDHCARTRSGADGQAGSTRGIGRFFHRHILHKPPDIHDSEVVVFVRR
ncbi:hypothetical protein GCM10009804_31080 [Kribbella hippodromi]|uniref:Uncharacterized protein n=1 Tax=Kribbella hippodromi TaxID=434347 RepID=A0ABP4P6G3_9ACTN